MWHSEVEVKNQYQTRKTAGKATNREDRGRPTVWGVWGSLTCLIGHIHAEWPQCSKHLGGERMSQWAERPFENQTGIGNELSKEWSSEAPITKEINSHFSESGKLFWIWGIGCRPDRQQRLCPPTSRQYYMLAAQSPEIWEASVLPNSLMSF